MAGCLDTKVSNTLVGNREVFRLFPGQSLHVDKNEPLIRKDEQIANQPVGVLDAFARRQKLGVVLTDFIYIYFLRVAHHFTKKSHDTSSFDAV